MAQQKIVADICRALGFAQPIPLGRQLCGGMQAEKAKRLNQLVKEGSRLKRLLAEGALEKAMLKELALGNF